MRRKLVYLLNLLWVLVGRDFKLRYKRSALGIIWSMLNPLAQLLVLNFVFRYVLPLNIEHYSTFLFCGILVWNWFQASLYAATGAVVDNSELVRRPGFPILILPLVGVSSQFIHFLLALPILGIFLVVSGIFPGWALLALPAVIVVQFILTLCIAYFLATLHVFFRDTQYLLGIALLLGFYISPVFYSSASIPQRFQFIYHLNPMAILIEAYRAILLEGQFPAWLPLSILLGVALLCGLLGIRLFSHQSNRFVEEL